MPRSCCRSSRPGLSIRLLPEDHERLADMLHGLGASLLADGAERYLARLALERRGADLDHLMGLRRAVDLGNHLLRQAFAANGDDRLELVRARLESLSLGGGEHSGKLVSKYTPCSRKTFIRSCASGGRAASTRPRRRSSRAGGPS